MSIVWNINIACIPCSNYLIDDIEDVKKNPEAVYGYDLSHQVAFFATYDAFYFDVDGFSTVCHGERSVHTPSFWVHW